MTADPGFLTAGYSSALAAAPDLYNAPSLAVTAAQSQDPTGTAQGLAHLAAQASVQQAVKSSGHWWSPITHALGDVAHAAAAGLHAVTSAPIIHQSLDLLSKPLGAVQHEYRYFKYVAAHGGYLKAFSELAAMTGVGIGVGIFTGGVGGVLAAEGVGRLFGAMDQKAWAASQTQGGSIGRDVAGLLGFGNTNSGFGKYLSGATDAAFDFTTDPLIVAGKARALTQSVKGLGAAKDVEEAGILTRNIKLLQSDIFMKQRAINMLFPGFSMATPEAADAALRNAPYRRALNDIAARDGAGIVKHYGPEIAPLARDLGAANTWQEAHDVFKWQSYRTEAQGRALTDQLPSRGVLRITAQKAYDKAVGNVDKKDELPLIAGRQAGGSFAPGLVFRPNLWLNSDAWKAAASKKARTFSGYMPFSINDATGDLSTRAVDISNDSNLQTFQRVAQFAMGNKNAAKWINDFTMLRDESGAALLNERKAAYGELLQEVLKAAGVPDDPEYMAQLTKWSRHLATGTDASTSYGFGHRLGDDVNARQLEDGTQRGALYGYQADSIVTLPNFRQLRSMVNDSTWYAKWYGKVDEFAAQHYTDSFFKPLALLSLGFGLRVAMAEAIPGVFRYGAANMLKQRLAISAAKHAVSLDKLNGIVADTGGQMGYRLVKGESGHVVAAMSKMVGGYDRLVNGYKGIDKFFNPDKTRRLAAELAMTNQNHIARGAVGAAHSTATRPDDPQTEAEYGVDQTLKRKLRLRDLHMQYGSGRFRNIYPDDPQYVDSWLYAAERRTREPSAQAISGDFRRAYYGPEANGLTEAKRQDYAAEKATEREVQRVKGINPDTGLNYTAEEDPYARERSRLMAYNEDPHGFAASRVDDVRNQWTGADLTVHDGLLKKFIAGDNRITAGDLRRIPIASRPLGMPGEIYEPFVPSDMLHAVISSGFSKIVNPVINWISREPLYFNEFLKQYRGLEQAEQAGILTHESAVRHAQVRTVRAILPQIHNTALRSQFSVLSRNFAPFYFAQEQALKRAGHLIRRNPAAFRKYQLMMHGMSDPGFIHKDDSGNRYLMFPLLGEFGSMALTGLAGVPGMNLQTGLPVSVGGDVESLKTVFPELTAPGTTPFAALALKKLTNLDPGFSELVKQVLGDRGYNADAWSAFMPNTAMRTSMHALLKDEGDRQFANAMLTAIQSAAYHGKLPGPGASVRDQAAFIDRIKNNARTILMGKAVLAAFSPLTPRVEQVDYNLRDEWYRLLDSTKGGYEAALQKFINEHGDKAVSYTISKTKSETGAYAPITQQAMDFVTQNNSLLVKHPWGAAFTVPQGANGKGDSQVIYDELLRTHLRERQTPEQFRDSLYIGQGMRQWQESYDTYQAALKQTLGLPSGATSEQVAAAHDNPTSSALRSSWGVWQSQDFAASQPLAYDYLTSDSRRVNAERAYNDITSMFADGTAPQNQQSQMLYGLSQDYERFRAGMVGLGAGTGDRSMGHQRTLLKASWDGYLQQMKTDQPLLANVIDAVFSKLEDEV